MSNLQTLSSQKLPRGFSAIKVDSVDRYAKLYFSSNYRARQFYKLFMRSVPFNLGIILGIQELSRVKAWCTSINDLHVDLKFQRI